MVEEGWPQTFCLVIVPNIHLHYALLHPIAYISNIYIALGMSYYSASMSWDHTRLTSSKVVAHNTCSTGTAIDRSEVYRYHQYWYQYRWCATRLVSRLPYCYRACSSSASVC